MSGERRVVAITGAGGTLGSELSCQFAGEADTDVALPRLAKRGARCQSNTSLFQQVESEAEHARSDDRRPLRRLRFVMANARLRHGR